MEAQEQHKLNFPEDLDVLKFTGMIQSLLDGIDRDRLFEDESLLFVRHPLIKEQIGKEIALNDAIYTLFMDFIIDILKESETVRRFGVKLALDASVIKRTLMEAAKDPELFDSNFETFQEYLYKLEELNPDNDGAEVAVFAQNQLLQKLKISNDIDEDLFYRPLYKLNEGWSFTDAIRVVSYFKKKLLKTLEGKIDDESVNTRKTIETKAAAAKAWFKHPTEAIPTINLDERIVHQLHPHLEWIKKNKRKLSLENFQEDLFDFFKDKAEELGMTMPVISVDQVGELQQLVLRDDFDKSIRPVYARSDEYREYFKPIKIQLTQEEADNLRRFIEERDISLKDNE